MRWKGFLVYVVLVCLFGQPPSSLPTIFIYVLILQVVILCLKILIATIIYVSSSFSSWLCWNEGCLRRRYMLFDYL